MVYVLCPNWKAWGLLTEMCKAAQKRGPDDGGSRGDVMSFSSGASAYYLSWLPAVWSEGLIVLFREKESLHVFRSCCHLLLNHFTQSQEVNCEEEIRATASRSPTGSVCGSCIDSRARVVALHEEESHTLHNWCYFHPAEGWQASLGITLEMKALHFLLCIPGPLRDINNDGSLGYGSSFLQ